MKLFHRTITFNYRLIAKKLLYTLTILASIILLIDITIVDLPNIQRNLDVAPTRLQFWICIYFLVDFILLMLIADNKWHYFKRYFLLVPLSIPYLNLFSYYEIDLPNNLLYLLKFLPILRGVVALILLINLLISNKITTLFIAYLSLLISIAYIQTLIFYLFESPVNPDVKNYYDVLWWASMTVTTLGSNIIPVTDAGKISTVILAVTGITVFPIFTVYVTTMVQAWSSRDKARYQHLYTPQHMITITKDMPKELQKGLQNNSKN
ncbi:potassium channel protein [Ignatzschineria ureiclastica]|uniref:Potassium channel protein n=1 Tax=Ignatzschineria ureiclastica TaxID=472582 RepID=A0A2U2AEZ7_9GAMM|nr:potassium channel family protein [Ignatzschineria ureiclastica]PWD81238.1 potassium channel protein [Ignatzschineria ureiclastica]GGZ97377.1 potassium channel protein [Ignatzschineria ureiclastica]